MRVLTVVGNITATLTGLANHAGDRVDHTDWIADLRDAETRAADSAREREDLSWKQWAERLQRYFSVTEALFSPDLIVVGGGVSKKHEKFLPLLDLRAPIVPATLLNAAGIVGAAALAARTATAAD